MNGKRHRLLAKITQETEKMVGESVARITDPVTKWTKPLLYLWATTSTSLLAAIIWLLVDFGAPVTPRTVAVAVVLAIICGAAVSYGIAYPAWNVREAIRSIQASRLPKHGEQEKP